MALQQSSASVHLRLSEWLPYRFFQVTARIARPLEEFYGERYGLTQSAWRILAAISERPGASASELGFACALDPFAVSRGIKQLVALEFAERTSAKNDRRYASVSITKKGATASIEIALLAINIEKRLLKSLSLDEQQSISRMLRKLDDESAHIESMGWRALLDGKVL
ncbi:MarR family winged helix-turn-helix transcriptional regulator [Burkholderia sp. S171]|uniref:MarR family winged helix-turn-helix transcriptional regulator n=1 Tax=Burkholderia sp. S171 TaxID=1641860 RepID=UPI0020B10ACE|nr:MarR family transcriptional regulator [Burkholderia sp. S171]